MEWIKEINKLFKIITGLRAQNKILNSKVEDLEKRIQALEREDIFERLGIKKVTEEPNNPWTPKVSPMVPTSPWIHPQPITCGKCGLKLDGVMGYSCPDIGCPAGLGPVMCGGNNV